MTIYIIILLAVIVLLVLGYIGKRKRRLRVARKYKLEINSRLIDKIDAFLKNYDLIYGIKERYVEKLGVINTNKRRHNNAVVIIAMLASVALTLVISIIMFKFMSLWYAVLVMGLLCLYLINFAFTLYLNTKLKKIYRQSPVAIQTFTDTYITTKSIKAALNDSYKDMPHEVGMVFEKLARRLASGHDYEKYIKEFPGQPSYVWGYAFAELLIMSYEGAGDISDDLLFLNELINDDTQDEEETKTEMATNKMLFLILNGCTLFAFIVNLLFNDVAKELYFYTPTGNTVIMIWVGVIAIGIGVSAILEQI